MDRSFRYLRSKLAELAQMEDKVLTRNPEEAALSRRSEAMLAYLMTDDEQRRWRRTIAQIAELRKLL